MAPSSCDVLFSYVSQGNPKSNEDLKQFPRLYPEYREEIIEFTATWRAVSILDKLMTHSAGPEPRQLTRRAKALLRAMRPRRVSARPYWPWFQPRSTPRRPALIVWRTNTD